METGGLSEAVEGRFVARMASIVPSRRLQVLLSGSSCQDRLDWPRLLGALYEFSANQSRSAVGDHMDCRALI